MSMFEISMFLLCATVYMESAPISSPNLFEQTLYLYIDPLDSPMLSGHAQLKRDAELPDVYCNYVEFPKHAYVPSKSIHVFLTMAWGKYHGNQTMNDAAASWSEDVTSSGFRACTVVAGRHSLSYNKNVSVYWVAVQKDTPEQKVGTIHFGTWYTGSRCEKLPEKYVSE